MNMYEAILLSHEAFRFIKCKFAGNNKAYSFKCVLQDLEVGDHVAVNTANGLQIVEVVDTDAGLEHISGVKYQWAFAKVDVNELKKLEEIEEELKAVARHAERKEAQRRVVEHANEFISNNGAAEEVATLLKRL